MYLIMRNLNHITLVEYNQLQKLLCEWKYKRNRRRARNLIAGLLECKPSNSINLLKKCFPEMESKCDIVFL